MKLPDKKRTTQEWLNLTKKPDKFKEITGIDIKEKRAKEKRRKR